MKLELIFGLASLIFGIYNILLFFSTGVYIHILLGIIFSIKWTYFMKTMKIHWKMEIQRNNLSKIQNKTKKKYS